MGYHMTPLWGFLKMVRRPNAALAATQNPRPTARDGTCPVIVPTGRHVIAQGNALGPIGPMNFSPERAELGGAQTNSSALVGFALSGLDMFSDLSQGVALGYHMAPLWGF